MCFPEDHLPSSCTYFSPCLLCISWRRPLQLSLCLQILPSHRPISFLLTMRGTHLHSVQKDYSTAGGHMSHSMHVEDNLQESVPQSWVIRLGGKSFYPLSQLASRTSPIFNLEQLPTLCNLTSLQTWVHLLMFPNSQSLGIYLHPAPNHQHLG